MSSVLERPTGLQNTTEVCGGFLHTEKVGVKKHCLTPTSKSGGQRTPLTPCFRGLWPHLNGTSNAAGV